MFKSGDFMANLITLRSSDAKRIWKSEIKLRDGNKCVYCGSTEELTIDHVRPRCKGGETNSHNCVTACKTCNQAKGSLPVEQFLLLQDLKWQEQQQSQVVAMELSPSTLQPIQL